MPEVEAVSAATQEDDGAMSDDEEPQLPCPHGRAFWQMCPHCLGITDMDTHGVGEAPGFVYYQQPACEVCGAPVRPGLQYCSGLSACWKKGEGIE